MTQYHTIWSARGRPIDKDKTQPFGLSGNDAAILIVCRRTYSEVESLIVLIRTRSLRISFNSPEHRRANPDDRGIEYGLALDAEEFSVGDILEYPAVVFSPDYDPLWRGIRIRWGEVRLRVLLSVLPSGCRFRWA